MALVRKVGIGATIIQEMLKMKSAASNEGRELCSFIHKVTVCSTALLVLPALLYRLPYPLCVLPAVVFIQVRRFHVGRGRCVWVVQQASHTSVPPYASIRLALVPYLCMLVRIAATS